MLRKMAFSQLPFSTAFIKKFWKGEPEGENPL